MYALAASAAGASALALAPPASAEVVFTPGAVPVRIGGSVEVDLNHDGIPDFLLWLNTPSSWGRVRPMEGSNHPLDLNIYPLQSTNRVWEVKSNGYPCAAALPKGTRVDKNSPFEATQQPLYMYRVYYFPGPNTQRLCSWKSGVQAYLGLKFVISGQVHYGWIRLRSHGLHNAYIHGYAYETIPNKAINTGDEVGIDDGLKQGATLGKLAQGRK